MAITLSSDSSLQTLWILLFIASCTVAARRLVVYALSQRSRLLYPPGPKPRWLVGNLLDMPTQNAAEVYIEWGKKYKSDILHMSALGTHIVVLNKRADVEELFERRANIYSDRPVIPITPLLGLDYNLAFYQYGPAWRRHLKVCKQNFGQVNVKQNYEPIIEGAVGHALRGLAKNPAMFEDCCKTFAVSIPLMSMYGYSPESLDDPVVSAATEAISISGALLLPGATLINDLPFLKYIPSWVPGNSSRKLADRVRHVESKAQSLLMDDLRLKMAKPDGSVSSNNAERSLIGLVLAAEARGEPITPEDTEASHNVARTVYTAASDTASSSTVTFIYLMAVNSDIQRKAQAEIDQVVGAGRLPNLADRESLPYVEAIYRELMRWKPPNPLALPHCLREDDEYKGYFLPKGSIVFSNATAICNDEEFYEDPRKFMPERFFDGKGALLESDPYPAFGVGRRTCPGLHLASASMWLFIASILASFDIGKQKDSTGNDIAIDADYMDLGIFQHKKHFECSITLRSVEASELIAKAGDML